MLHVYHTGRKETQGEPLLLIHALGAYGGIWEPVLPLLESRHEVLVPDLPGFGKSPPLPNGVAPDVHGLADALEVTMNQAGLSTAHVAGHSLGGLLALELGRRGRARTVCAISPAGKGQLWEYAYALLVVGLLRFGARGLYRLMPVLTRSAALRMLMFWLVASRPWRMDPELATALAHAYADAEAFYKTLLAVDWRHAGEGFADIACPVVIGWGSRDRLLLPRQGPPYAKAIPGARLVRLRGLGHAPMTDDPLEVADLILRTTQLA